MSRPRAHRRWRSPRPLTERSPRLRWPRMLGRRLSGRPWMARCCRSGRRVRGRRRQRRQPPAYRRPKRGLRRGHPPTRRRRRRHPNREHPRTCRRQSPRPGCRRRRLAGGSATPLRRRLRMICRLNARRPCGYPPVQTRGQTHGQASPKPRLRAGLLPRSQLCSRLGADHHTQPRRRSSVLHRQRPHHCVGCQIPGLRPAEADSRLPRPGPRVKR